MMGHSEESLWTQGRREQLDSFTEMPTHLITLSPAFLEALRKVAPKARPRKLQYVLAFAAVVSIGWASGQRLFPPRAAAVVPVAAPPPADFVAMPPSARQPTPLAPNASGGEPPAPAAAAPMTISVDALPRASIPKPSTVTKHRDKPVQR